MIIAMPIMIAPMMIASAVLWSSSISFLTENGATSTTIKNAISKNDQADRDKDNGRRQDRQQFIELYDQAQDGAIDKRFSIIFLHEILNKKTARRDAICCRN